MMLMAACLALATDAMQRDHTDREGAFSAATRSARDASAIPAEVVNEVGAEDVELQGESGAEGGNETVALSVVTPLANQIQIAQQRATSIAKAFNGSWSAIRTAGKLDDMLKEYQQAVEGNDARQLALRTEGNAKVKNYTETENLKLKERKDRQYTEQMVRGRADLNKSKEEAMAAIYQEKQQHAIACKKLMDNNPYPVNSTQYAAVKTSCAGEDARNLDNATLWRPGSHDGGSGPNGGLAGSTPGQRGEGPYEDRPPPGAANATSWYSQTQEDETEVEAVEENDEDLQF